MNYKIDLSVHALVDFVLRKGDIDNRYFNIETMSEGSSIHRSYQKRMGSNYQSEYFLSYSFKYNEFEVNLSGRADGVIIIDNKVIIDEIKSTNKDLEEFYNENLSWHLGQAKVYAFMYCKSFNLSKISVKLTYISQTKYKEEFHNFDFTFSELEEFFNLLVEEYFKFHTLIYFHRKDRNIALKSLQFPYFFKNKHQDELIDYVSASLSSNKRVLIEAPTGIGKTVSVLYPCFKKYSSFDRVFYLTAKGSGKEIVDKTVDEIIENSSILKVIILTSKEKLCPNSDVVCNPDNCPYAKDYYSKLNECIYDAYNSDAKVYNYNFFKKAMEKYQICPFEFQLDLSLVCDLIVGDYNYIFDPFVYLQRYMDNDVSNSLLLIDEAHNLLERTRNMFSCELSKKGFENLSIRLKSLKSKKIHNNIDEIISFFNSIEQEKEYEKINFFPETLIKLLEKYVNIYRDFIKKHTKVKSAYKSMFHEINRFLKLYDLEDGENFINYCECHNDNVKFKILCISPTKYINSTSNRFKNAILFSATLTPFDYYNQVYFANDSSVDFKQFDSPFDKEKVNFMLNSSVSIKYKDRLDTLNTVVSNIVALASSKIGNYFVFVPSYEYLSLVVEKLNTFDGVFEVLPQTKEMNEKERDNYIKKFNIPAINKSKVGICVIGGSFSESINLIGDSLIGVVVVGVGMPSFNFENEEIKKHYENNELNGFYYSYLVPGMKNVIQSIGRLIRSKSDIGNILLIDDRYTFKQYQKFFKKEWGNYKVINNEYDIIKNIKDFYKKWEI